MRSGYRGPESVAGRGLAGGKGGGQGRRHLGAEGARIIMSGKIFRKMYLPVSFFI